jgi:hypothetical protein
MKPLAVALEQTALSINSTRSTHSTTFIEYKQELSQKQHFQGIFETRKIPMFDPNFFKASLLIFWYLRRC